MIETGGDYRESIALNGREGLDLHAEDPADLVVTDLNMVGIDGFEVIRQIGAHSTEIKIVVLSGASQETEQKAIEMGAVCSLSRRRERNWSKSSTI